MGRLDCIPTLEVRVHDIFQYKVSAQVCLTLKGRKVMTLQSHKWIKGNSKPKQEKMKKTSSYLLFWCWDITIFIIFNEAAIFKTDRLLASLLHLSISVCAWCLFVFFVFCFTFSPNTKMCFLVSDYKNWVLGKFTSSNNYFLNGI